MLPALRDSSLDFSLQIVTHAEGDSEELVLKGRTADGSTERPLTLRWPDYVFSQSHGSLPIPADDPVYGPREAVEGSGVPLGALFARGETGVLAFSESLFIRLRYNPFYEFTEDHVVDWLNARLGLSDEPQEPVS